MNEIIQPIIQSIKQRVPELTKSAALAKIDEDGRVLIKDETRNEYRFAGIHDHDDGYYYIRFRNDGRIKFSESSNNKKFASIQQFFRTRYELRIVACVRNADAICLEEKIRAAVINAVLPSNATFANVMIDPIESTIDSISVVRDETPNGKQRPFDINMTFVAFDFDVVGDRDVSLDNYCANPCDGPSC